MPELPGVNVAGYLTGELGLGTTVRGFIKALEHLQVPLSLNNFSEGMKDRSRETDSQFTDDNPNPVNLICVNADHMSLFRARWSADYFRDKYNIACWWWELPEFPCQTWDQFAPFDEIWVGSSYVQQSIGKYSPIPVISIKPVISPPSIDLSHDWKKEFNLPPSEFSFLFVFDYLSDFERKNPMGLVRAFREAFSPEDNARLVIKTLNGNKAPEVRDQLKREAGTAKITFIEERLPTNKLMGLSAACDAYVSLHRAEGFGLPLAEAMLIGKPVMATDWSGNMDFMTQSNSYLVPSQLVRLQADSGPYKRGELWADPSVENAAQLMRRMLEKPLEARERAAQARLDIQREYSTEAVADRILARLLSIQELSKRQPHEKGAPEYLKPEFASALGEMEFGRLIHLMDIPESTTNSSSALRRTREILRKLFMPFLERQSFYNSINNNLLLNLSRYVSRLEMNLSASEERLRDFVIERDHKLQNMEREIVALQLGDSKKNSKTANGMVHTDLSTSNKRD